MYLQGNTRITVTAVAVCALLLAGSCLFPVDRAQASTFETGDNVHISNLQHIDDDLYISGEEVVIEGTVLGDLVSAGYHTEVSGVVEGAANFFSYHLDESGRVGGSLRFFAYQALLNAPIGRSVVGGGYLVNLGQNSVVEGDVTVFGNDLTIGGIVKGDVEAAGTNVRITGTIEGNVRAKGEKITIIPPAIIRGNLTYMSRQQDALDTLSGVTIVGDVVWEEPEVVVETEDSLITTVLLELSSLLAAFLFGVIVLRLFRPYAQEAFETLRSKTTVSLAAGLLGVLVVAFCMLLLIFALISTIVGTILLQSEQAVGVFILVFSILMIPITAFISISGMVILYSAKILVALMIGYPLMRAMRPSTGKTSVWALLAGLVIVTIVCAIPYLGFLVALVIALAGSGAIILGIKNCRKEGAPVAMPDAPPMPPSPPKAPKPPIPPTPPAE